MKDRVHLDFETRSYADLKAVGAWEYSMHPSTEILCMAWCVNDSKVFLWKQGDPLPLALFSWITYGATICAHNAFFEQSIWKNVCLKMGWISIPDNQWMCTLAKASAHALPRGLGACGRALGLTVTKDEVGSAVMKKLTKFRKPTKTNPSVIPGTPEEYRMLYQYCRTDVESERAIDHALKDLTPFEHNLWLLDQKMNMNGVKIDREAVCAALDHLTTIKLNFENEVSQITNGKLTKLTEVAKLKTWIAEMGEGTMASLDKKAVKDKLQDSFMHPDVYRILEIRQDAGKSSTAKYTRFLEMSSAIDGRARGNLRYHGASTGRWAGMGIQMQNLAKGEKIDDVDIAVAEMVCTPTTSLIEKHPKTMLWMSSLIRSMIIAEEGHIFDVADYNAIEARVVMWLAGEMETLNSFDSGAGIYRDMASTIYNKKAEGVTDDERQLGKTVILGGGFGMGFFKFLATLIAWEVKIPDDMINQVIKGNYDELRWKVEKYFEDINNRKRAKEIDLDPEKDLHRFMFANHLISSYRNRFTKITAFWKQIEDTAIAAVMNVNKVIPCGKILWMSDGEFLWMKLPSGRKLAYYKPEVRRIIKFGRESNTLTFMAVGDKNNWVRQQTYGGALTENATQAVARDIMAEAMVRVDNAGYPVVLTIHDEIISETRIGHGSNEEFCRLLSIRPEWGQDLPLKVAGWRGTRYKKG